MNIEFHVHTRYSSDMVLYLKTFLYFVHIFLIHLILLVLVLLLIILLLVCLSSIGLIALAPVFLLIGIAIKIDSKGPAFFVHKRIGKNGEYIYLYKFRSMYSDSLTPHAYMVLNIGIYINTNLTKCK